MESYLVLAEVLKKHQVRHRFLDFVQPRPRQVDERFEKELTFVLQNIDVRASGAAAREFLIAPTLLEAWRPFSDSLLLWAQVPFRSANPEVVPDYFFCRRGALGIVRDVPLAVVVQTRKDDFELGWAQCLAALVAAQKIHGEPAPVLFGCVSSGKAWEFGKLEGQDFTRDLRTFVLGNLPALFAALNDVFARAKEQALAAVA